MVVLSQGGGNDQSYANARALLRYVSEKSPLRSGEVGASGWRTLIRANVLMPAKAVDRSVTC